MRRLVFLVAAVALAVGCSGPPAEKSAEASGSSAVPSADSAASRAPSTQSTTAPAASARVPDTTAGDLGADDVPSASALGKGWTAYADPGGPEEGFEGNGDFVRARDPAEVVRSVVPLGCPGVGRVPRIPRPAHALEATYRDSTDRPAVALVLSYPRPREAVSAIRAIRRMRGTCVPPPKGEPPGRPRSVIDLTRANDRVIWDLRRSSGSAQSVVWDEVVVRVEGRLALLARPHASGEAGHGHEELTRELRRRLTR